METKQDDGMVMVKIKYNITLPNWNYPYNQWITLEAGYCYQIPKVWAMNLMEQGYIQGVSNETKN